MTLKEEIIYGKHSVREALYDDMEINKLFLQKDLQVHNLSDILKIVKQRDIIISEVPKNKLDIMTDGANHQGVVLSISPYDYQMLDDIFELAASKSQDPFILILDQIEDPHNLGSIIRTADAFGVHGIIIPKRRSAQLTGAVAKTSTGAIQHVPIVRVTNLNQTVDQLKERGVWVFATDMAGEDVRKWNSSGPLAIIIGNEGTGVSRQLLKSADGMITIPMVGHVQSLNASVATAIAVYEVARNRMPEE